MPRPAPVTSTVSPATDRIVVSSRGPGDRPQVDRIETRTALDSALGSIDRLRHNGVVSAREKKSGKEPAMSPSDLPVEAALDRASGPRRAEADELLAVFGELTGEKPVVWAGRIVGFGEVEYLYESGHGGRMPLLAFATGSREHTIYLETGFAERWPDFLEKLGKHRASKACLYVTRLSDVNPGV